MFLQLLTGLSLLKVGLGAFCDKKYTVSSGTVTSPSYSSSSSYDNNLDCKFDIKVSSGSGIHLKWSSFDVKGNMPNCDDDYVEIYIGCGRRSIGRFCSNNLRGNHPFGVYSRDNCLRLKFHSDRSGTGTGFKAIYSSFSLASGTSSIGAECSSSSERFPKVRSEPSEVISSPNWPNDYPSLRDCYWRIDVPSNKNIKIAFMDFDLEYDIGCDDDKVKIKEGYSSDSYDRSITLKDSMCGNKSPFYFTSTKRRIWIRFKSDSFHAERGFVAGYIMYDSSTSTSGKSTSRSPVVGTVVGIIIVLVIIVGCIYFVYRRRLARRQQQAAVVVPPPQQMAVHHPPPPPQPGYAPPPQSGYGAPLPGNAPPPYGQVAGSPYPQQDKPGPYPATQPGGAPPYQPGQPGGVPPYPPGQTGGAAPYPPEQPGGAPPPAAPYPTAPPPSGAAPYPPQ